MPGPSREARDGGAPLDQDLTLSLTRRGLLRSSVSGSLLLMSGGLGGLLAGCGSGGGGATGGGGTTTGVSDKEIKLGLTSGITGPYPDSGRQYAGWLQRTIDAKNRAGGVHGRQIKLTTLDDGGDAQRAVANVQRLVREEQVFAMCSLGSGTTAAFMDMLIKQKVPLLFPGASFDALTKPPKPGVYSLFPGYDVQTAAITKWAVGKFGPGSAVVVRANLPTWDQPTAQARKVITSTGGNVAAVINTTYGQPEWGSVVTRIKKASPDYVVMISTALDMGALWKEMFTRQITPKKAAVGVSSIVDLGFIRAAGEVPDDKVFGAIASTLPPGAPQTDPVQARWPQQELGPYGLWGALAGDTIVAVLDKVGKDLSRERLTQVLDSQFGPFKTDYSSEIRSSPTHLLAHGISVAGINGGKFGPAGDGFVS